jgi:NADH:ubiquinone oxidoreductase subunit 6 (subunit J)
MRRGVWMALGAALLALIIAFTLLQIDWPEGDMDELGNEEVAETLFGTTDDTGYGLILFLVGILLLVALLGGVFLAKEERE